MEPSPSFSFLFSLHPSLSCPIISYFPSYPFLLPTLLLLTHPPSHLPFSKLCYSNRYSLPLPFPSLPPLGVSPFPPFLPFLHFHFPSSVQTWLCLLKLTFSRHGLRLQSLSMELWKGTNLRLLQG